MQFQDFSLGLKFLKFNVGLCAKYSKLKMCYKVPFFLVYVNYGKPKIWPQWCPVQCQISKRLEFGSYVKRWNLSFGLVCSLFRVLGEIEQYIIQNLERECLIVNIDIVIFITHDQFVPPGRLQQHLFAIYF